MGAVTMIDNPTWTLAQRLHKARVLADLDQGEVAARINVARNTISNWETGKRTPSFEDVVRFARATGADLEWLAAGINDVTPAEAGATEGVRPKGLEPLTFWFGVSEALDLILWEAELAEAVER